MGTSPLFYYTLAYYLEQQGKPRRRGVEKKAQGAAGIVDRFPYRRESEAPLRDAVRADPNDVVARFNLDACSTF